MASMEVPRRQMLNVFPISTNASRNSTALLGMEVAIGEKIKDVIESIKRSTVTHVSLGKKPAFIIDNTETHGFQAIRRQRCFLYRGEPGVGEGELTLVGRLDLQDTAVKPKPAVSETLDLNDPALLSLQQSLAEHAQRKQANTTVFVEDSSQLPPAKSGRQAVKAAKAAKSRSKNANLLNPHRQGLFDQGRNGRSTPTSPSLSGMTPSAASKPSREFTKQDALKMSFMHLLAVRPVSQSFITRTLNCTSADIKSLLEKYGRPNRLNPDKFELSDRGYKDLDVWKFPYKNQEERDGAIENAIGAFDRQRISISEHAWQMLLPKDKRGKGTVLSKLKLHTDAAAVPRARTPKIQVSSSGDSKVNKPRPQSEDKAGHLSPNAAVTGAAGSPGNNKKSSLSEKETQSKTLPSKASAKPSPSITAKATPASPTMAAKKNTKKIAPITNGKIKSAEFIEDSDDEDFPLDDVPAKPAPKPTSSTTKKVDTSGKPNQQDKSIEAPKAAPKRTEPAPAPSRKQNAAESAPKAQPMARQVSHHRKSSSPLKPSPLGSSPPANASDIDNDNPVRSSKSSSSSSSPLMNQRATFTQKAPLASRSGKVSAAADRVDKPLKRKASELEVSNGAADNSERVKRRPSTDVSSGNTTSQSPGRISSDDIKSSLRFKQMQETYASRLSELRKQSNPPMESVEKLRRMHAKLTEHKASLWRLAAAT